MQFFSTARPKTRADFVVPINFPPTLATSRTMIVTAVKATGLLLLQLAMTPGPTGKQCFD